MTDNTDLIKRLRFRGRLGVPLCAEAAEALDAVVRLAEERLRYIVRLESWLPDGVPSGYGPGTDPEDIAWNER